MSEVTPKTYTALATMPRMAITRCSFILENKLQCWRAGDYEVVETLSPATEKDPATTRVFQLCTRHAMMQQAIDAGRMKLEDAIKNDKAQLENQQTGQSVDAQLKGSTEASTSTGDSPTGENTGLSSGGNTGSDKPPSPTPATLSLNPDGPGIPVGTKPPEPVVEK